MHSRQFPDFPAAVNEHASKHRSLDELTNGLAEIRRSPADRGVVEAIVFRPTSNERVSVEECEVSAELGIHGDHWAQGCWRSLPDGSPDPDVQVAIMNARAAALIAQERERWPLAGDNLYVDLDIGEENLSPGQRLTIGSVVLEITAVPHTGCRKFSERFGRDAAQFVNSADGKKLRLRGIYGKVVRAGMVRVGDEITKV